MREMKRWAEQALVIVAAITLLAGAINGCRDEINLDELPSAEEKDDDGDGILNADDDFPTDPNCATENDANCGACGAMCSTGLFCGINAAGQTACLCDDPKYTGPGCDACANPNATGPNCDLCLDPRYTGPNCDQCADETLDAATCEPCVNPGFIGPDCTSCAAGVSGEGCDQCENENLVPPSCTSCHDSHFQAPDCNACKPAFTGANCDTCTDPHFTGTDCNECASGFSGSNCDQCENPHFEAPACVQCLPEFTGTNCDQCANPLWSGPDCDQCANPNMTGVDCDECVFNYTGPNCDQCAPAFTGANCDECDDPTFVGIYCDECADPTRGGADCTECSENFTGPDCTECADDKFTGELCNECSDPKFAGPNCDDCIANFSGPDCEDCAPGFAGDDCSPISGGPFLVYKTYTLYDSTSYSSVNNNDGKVQPGESIRLNVEIENVGTVETEGVEVELSSNTACATIDPIYDSADYGTIYADEVTGPSAGSSKYYRVDVSTACAEVSELSFTLTMTDASFAQWTDSFSLPVTAQSGATLEYLTNTLYDSTSYSSVNNNDGKAQPGESIRLNVQIENTGSSTAIDVEVEIASNTPCATVEVLYNSAGYGTVYSDEITGPSAGSSKYYRVTLSTTCTAVQTLDFTLTMTDNNLGEWTDTFSVPVTAETGADLEFLTYALYDSTSYSSVNNNDGDAQPGESIRLNVSIENTGSSTAIDVDVEIASNTPCATVDVLYNSAGYGTIYVDEITGASAGSSKYYRVTLSTTCTSVATLDFTLTMTDNNLGEWTDTFSVPVTTETGADLEFLTYSLYDSTSYSGANNNDGEAQPGESIRLNVSIENTGSSTAIDVEVKITSNTPCATVDVLYNSAGYGTIYVDEITGPSAGSSKYFRVNLSSGCSSVSSLNFTLTMTDNNLGVWTDTFSVPVD